MNGPPEMGMLWSVSLAVFLSFLLTGLATWYAHRRGMLDHPSERHSHTESTPRGGGAGLVVALLLVSFLMPVGGVPAYWANCMAPCIVVLALTGWWDDHSSLSARFRFFIQLAVSLYLISCAAQAGWLQGIFPMLFGGLYLIWMTNLYNFMDGSNGMAGLQGVFAAVVLAWLFHLSGDAQFTLIALIVAACCAGFLPWNLGRARVFMGDVGSLSLGFIFASLLLYGLGREAFSLPVAWLLMLLFMTDSTLTLLLRVLRGERWYNPHKQHLYQLLIAHGWSHGRVVLFYQVINLSLVLPGIAVSMAFPALAWPVAVAMTLVFVPGWYLLVKRFGVLAQAG